MKFLAAASVLFVGTLAVPTGSSGGSCRPRPPPGNGGNYPGGGGNNPGGNNGGGNNPGGNNGGGNGPYNPCTSTLYSNPQCCATNVLGVAALDCKNRMWSRAAGQSVLCVPVSGGGSNPGGNNGGGSNPGGNNGGGSNPGGNNGGGSNPGGNNGGGSNPGGNNGGGSNPGGNNGGGSNPGGNNGGGSNPGGNNGGGDALCPSGLYSNPQCCATDVLGVADLNCVNRESIGTLAIYIDTNSALAAHKPMDSKDFQQTCASSGKAAQCCVIPVAGQALLCTPAVGGNGGSNTGGNGGNGNGGNGSGGNGSGGNGSGGNGNYPGNGGNGGGSGGNGSGSGGNGSGGNNGGNYKACTSALYGNAQCCATDILGIAALDCGNREYLQPAHQQCILILTVHQLLTSPPTPTTSRRLALAPESRPNAASSQW
ncbi:beta ketoadipyl CoA thiolase, th1 [Claviceps digitariae]|nr:beta ketoadipyl CoA thiolase, th1 [Claviceps digitariae]